MTYTGNIWKLLRIFRCSWVNYSRKVNATDSGINDAKLTNNITFFTPSQCNFGIQVSSLAFTRLTRNFSGCTLHIPDNYSEGIVSLADSKFAKSDQTVISLVSETSHFEIKSIGRFTPNFLHILSLGFLMFHFSQTEHIRCCYSKSYISQLPKDWALFWEFVFPFLQ